MACTPQPGVPAEESVVRHALGLGRDGKLEVNDEGWDSRVYILDRGAAVFKFPRSPETRTPYAHELSVLDALERIKTPVRLPQVRWRHPDLAWFGYSGIVGRPLSSCLRHLEHRTRAAIGHVLGAFLREFHTLRIAGLPVISIDEEISGYQKKYRQATAALDALSPQERAEVHAFYFEVLPAEMRRLGGDLHVTHGDLGPWNIILTDSLEVGVIDFGDAAYQDASKDFSAFGDEVVLNSSFEAYAADRLMREKAFLRIRAFPILDLPFYLRTRDDNGVRCCLDLLRRRIVRGELAIDSY